MHILQLSRRNGAAQERILKAAGKLAQHFGIKPEFVTALEVQQKDPAIRAMLERESVANLLEEIARANRQPLIDMTAVQDDLVVSESGEGEVNIAAGNPVAAPEPAKKTRGKKKADIPPPVLDALG